jgi:hypothetical protein
VAVVSVTAGELRSALRCDLEANQASQKIAGALGASVGSLRHGVTHGRVYHRPSAMYPVFIEAGAARMVESLSLS